MAVLTAEQSEEGGEGAGAGVGGGQVGVGGQLGPRMFCLFFLSCLHFLPRFPLGRFDFPSFFNFPNLAFFFLLLLFFCFLNLLCLLNPFPLHFFSSISLNSHLYIIVDGVIRRSSYYCQGENSKNQY